MVTISINFLYLNLFSTTCNIFALKLQFNKCVASFQLPIFYLFFWFQQVAIDMIHHHPCMSCPFVACIIVCHFPEATQVSVLWQGPQGKNNWSQLNLIYHSGWLEPKRVKLRDTRLLQQSIWHWPMHVCQQVCLSTTHHHQQ